MDVTKFVLSYFCCILALYVLRSGAQLAPWPATTARAIVYLVIYVFPAAWVLKGQRRQLRQPTTAPEGEEAGECSKAIASVDCSSPCISFQLDPKYEWVVAPDTEEQPCTDCSPVALTRNQQKLPLLPPEVSLRDWKGRSTTGDVCRSSRDGAGCSISADGACYPFISLGPCHSDLSVGLSHSGITPSCSLSDRQTPAPAAELDYSTSDACLSMPTPFSGQESALAGLSSARSYDLSPEASNMCATLAHHNGSSPLEMYSGTIMGPPSAAAPAAPLFRAGDNSCSPINAVGHDSCSETPFSRHLLDTPVQAGLGVRCSIATHMQEAVPAATATAAVDGVELAGVEATTSDAVSGAAVLSLDSNARSQPTSAGACSSGLCVSSSNYPFAEAAAWQAPVSSQQIDCRLNCPAAARAAANPYFTRQGAGTGASAAAAGGGYSADALQDSSAQLSTPALALQAAAGCSAIGHAGHVVAVAPLPMPPDLTISTLRRAVSAQHLPPPQRDEQPGSAGSVAKSEGSADQPSTPVFVVTSSRFLRHTVSAVSGCLGSRSSSSGMNRLPLPSPADSPLARRVTNERDEYGFPLTPGLVELLQQREQQISSGKCDGDDQQGLQQSAVPWAGLQLRSVSQRLSSEECSSCRTGSLGSSLSYSTSTDDSSAVSMAGSSHSGSVSSGASGASRFQTVP